MSVPKCFPSLQSNLFHKANDPLHQPLGALGHQRGRHIGQPLPAGGPAVVLFHPGVSPAAVELQDHIPLPWTGGRGGELGIVPCNFLKFRFQKFQIAADFPEPLHTLCAADQHAGDAPAVVQTASGAHSGILLMEAPEIADGNIRPAFIGGVGTAVAVAAVDIGLQEIVHIGVQVSVFPFPEDGAVGFSVLGAGDHALAPGFCSEMEARDGHLPFFCQRCDEICEHFAAGDAMADQLHRQQVLIFPAQISLQTGDLAGGAGIEHPAAFAQVLFHTAEGQARVAMHVFGALEGRQIRKIIDADMGRHRHAGLHGHGGAVYRSARCQGVTGQHSEDAAGGGSAQHFIVPGRRSIAGNGKDFRSVSPVMADLFAQATFYTAFLIDLWIEEADLVRDQDNGVPGADIDAGAAAGTFLFIGEQCDSHGAAPPGQIFCFRQPITAPIR